MGSNPVRITNAAGVTDAPRFFVLRQKGWGVKLFGLRARYVVDFAYICSYE